MASREGGSGAGNSGTGGSGTGDPSRGRPRQAASRKRGAARLYAVQALFQMEAQGTVLETALREFETYRIGAEIDGQTYEEADIDLFRLLVTEAVSRQAAIDQMTDAALVDRWPIDRIDPTLRALFRAAGAELLAGKAPPRVVISEFVETAHAFFPEGREPKLVNAVLDQMARSARPQAFT
ncbi:MAG: transcription antitermination factor NusB [Pseudomonadota bacterium]